MLGHSCRIRTKTVRIRALENSSYVKKDETLVKSFWHDYYSYI
jgi:hypothetical protein